MQDAATHMIVANKLGTTEFTWPDGAVFWDRETDNSLWVIFNLFKGLRNIHVVGACVCVNRKASGQ